MPDLDIDEMENAESGGAAQTDFIYCYGAITEVLRCGPPYLHTGHKVLVLVIPGNPGVVGFYRTFIQTLYALFGCHHPVWAVSHAGHCTPPASMDMVEDADSTTDLDTFGLNGQIEHKLTFIRKHVPKETNLILVGHSIGCYIILEIMRRDPSLKILKAVMLFPTIERMAQTPQGKTMTPVLCHMRYIAYLSIFLLSLLPETFKRSLVKLVFAGIGSLDSSVVQPTVGLLSGDSAANAVYMAGQEMRKVLQRDNVTIKKNLEKLIFYYGATDHWCPVQYYNEIQEDFPTGDFRLCENGFRHAFVLDAGREVAKMIAGWIQPHLRI
ncbi:lipid droplet-associated hydrolase isoform X1 [Hippocampus comes]|uniref:lipid droplet-associated hydrolase isoform X1 n=1 Tax=Hippocampus comes TaxID=109280 RepID=UPI00094ECB51|nr:PREDICTED: lipid droplet-associated hydrolase isoform X1 [Hippocampus comes]XP_019739738.1 PREDICTED: lipid droplet-associated hydrolase isoform X1 [Hippocampus comes]XP_019739746.1 PREDICTED: lipid droplet-associated hydrolase isoform X1 [Hippocampus comes]XP_019739756.1 PREDICTED: lipid droplet-associated hydrolase isoform X1 [Hippocampus comes]